MREIFHRKPLQPQKVTTGRFEIEQNGQVAYLEYSFRGNILELILAVPLYASAYLILGFAFSAVAESQLQAVQGAVFFYLPSMLLSGFMFPFEGMPRWARTIGEALPLTHFVRATRCVFFRGQCGSLVLSEMVPVAVFGLIASAGALLAYRRRID